MFKWEWSFNLCKMTKSMKDERNRMKCLLPVFLCQLHHHGWQLIQHKDTRQTLVSQQPVCYFLMSCNWELVSSYHLPGNKHSKGCFANREQERLLKHEFSESHQCSPAHVGSLTMVRKSHEDLYQNQVLLSGLFLLQLKLHLAHSMRDASQPGWTILSLLAHKGTSCPSQPWVHLILYQNAVLLSMLQETALMAESHK